MFRRLVFAPTLLSLIALTGCESSTAPTSPQDLPPLTEAQKAEIQKNDDVVKEEEGRPSVIPKEFQKAKS